MDLYESKRLREERAAVVKRMNDLSMLINKEERNFNTEELATFDTLDAEQKRLKDRIDTVERIESIQGIELAKPADRQELRQQQPYVAPKITQQDRNQAFRGWALAQGGQPGAVTRSMREAADKLGVNLGDRQFSLRAQSSDNTAEGGLTANSAVVQAFEKSLLDFGNVRGVANVVTTSHGNALRWATNNDTTNTGAWHAAQNSTVANVSMTFGAVTLNAYTHSSGVFPVSLELLADSELNIESIIGSAMGERLSRLQNTAYTTGNGTNKPTGIVNGSTLGATASGTATFVVGDIYKLIHSVDRAYRRDPSFGLMCHDTVLRDLKLLNDTSGRPLWQVNIAPGAPDTFDGIKIGVNNDMNSTAATGNKFMLAGAFNRYVIRDVAPAFNLVVLKESYIVSDLALGFVAHARTDGKIVNAAAIKHLKYQ